MSEKDTPRRILDVAERLIAEKGIGNTSLRSIINEAGVNLAAVHYHFGSKQALVLEVFKRHLEPVNRQRLQLLDELEQQAGDAPVALEAIIRAFFQPIINLQVEQPHQMEHIMKLFGRVFVESKDTRSLIFQQFSEVVRRFTAAFCKTLPHLTLPEIILRMKFMIGAMQITMMAPVEFKSLLKTDVNLRQPGAAFEHLIKFAASGFAAPLPDLDKK